MSSKRPTDRERRLSLKKWLKRRTQEEIDELTYIVASYERVFDVKLEPQPQHIVVSGPNAIL